MKQQILGSFIGEIALSSRERFEILNAAYFHPEFVGTVANNHLATKLVTSMVRPHTTFIDIGAHIGSITGTVIYKNPSIKVVAIEAIPNKVRKLRKKFPSIELHCCAVGEYSGNVSFFVNETRSGFSSLQRPNERNQDKIVEITVPIKRLDDIVAPDNVDTIKIDVEGAELGVLRGSIETLNRSRPTIMFESGPALEGTVEEAMKHDLYSFFSSNDYVVLVPNRVAHNDHGLTEDGFVESHLYPYRSVNYFAIARERRLEIRNRARRILGIPIKSA